MWAILLRTRRRWRACRWARRWWACSRRTPASAWAPSAGSCSYLQQGPAVCSQGDYDRRGQHSGKCNFVHFYKWALPPCSLLQVCPAPMLTQFVWSPHPLPCWHTLQLTSCLLNAGLHMICQNLGSWWVVLVTSVTAVNVSYDGVTCDRWGAQTAIVLFNYHIPQCWWMWGNQ